MVPSGSKQTGCYWAPEWGISWLLHLRWQMAQRHQDLVLCSSLAWDKLQPAAQLVASSEQQENSHPPLPGTGLFRRCCAEGYWQVLHGYFMCLISPSSEVEVAQLCLTLCDPMHYIVHGIFQLNHKGSPRILEWVAYPFFSWSSWPKNQTRVSCIAGGFLTNPVAQLVESACNAGDLGSIPRLGRSPGEGNGNPFQYSCLENSMDRGSWWATVHGWQRVRHDGVTNTCTQLASQTITQECKHLAHCRFSTKFPFLLLEYRVKVKWSTKEEKMITVCWHSLG